MRRKLKIAALTVASVFAIIGIAALPTASADQCTVTVTLLTGQTETFSVNVPPGTPASQMVPAGVGPVTNVSASCAPAATTTTSSTTPSGTTGSSGSGSSGSGTTGTTGSSSSHPKGSGGNKNAGGHHGSTGSKGTTGSTGSTGSKSGTTGSTGPKTSTKPSGSTKPAGPTGPTGPGVPTATNPTFSFALPGPAPMGVPNFFIDAFRIPPFLLPIYQAAGIEYDVPWQVLAAINEIETDYGRNLSVSSAGAVGWMQFMPETWKKYGVDATGSGYADPYNPVDAIFAAARYLHAAGASTNLPDAIYSYNHAWWYVQSVLLRAKLVGGMPTQLIGALTGLVEGHFPVAAAAKYADSSVTKLAKQRVKTSNAAITIDSNAGATATNIFAKQGSPVIAVNDGKIVKVGYSQQLGNYIELQDATGNVYTYAQLGSIPKLYPVPKPVTVTAKEIASELSQPLAPTPKTAATAGSQGSAPTVTVAKATTESKGVSLPVTPAAPRQPAASSAAPSGDAPTSIPTPMVKERLFADPHRTASYAAGGMLQIKNSAPSISNFQNYFSAVLHLGKNEYTLQALKPGASVVAGTILGRLGAGTPTLASHLQFMVRPAGKNAPYIDPKPILDGWKLLEATAVYRAAGVDPFFGQHAKNASIGQVLLMSKEQLQNRVLADPRLQVYACGRRDIQAGLIDRRILAVIEFLAGSGLDPTVSGLACGSGATGSGGVDSAGASGSSVDFSAINGIPVKGHQGKGSITDLTIRRLLTLQGTFKPDQIVSTMTYKNQANTVSMPDHANRIQVSYTPLFGQNKKISSEIANLLKPGQWLRLINHLSQIPEPVVPIAPSKYAIKVSGVA
jgi:Transglycosylase SLT domain/Peptidase family M23